VSKMERGRDVREGESERGRERDSVKQRERERDGVREIVISQAKEQRYGGIITMEERENFIQ
jgi:hypothetical protein